MTELPDPPSADPDLVATVREVIADESPGRWDRLAGLGLTRLTAPEAEGGSGAGWREAAVVVGELAAQGKALPVGEHDLLAGWLLRSAGLPGDDRRRTAAILRDGTAAEVPFAAESERVVCLWQDGPVWRVADVPADSLTITSGENLAGEPRDTVTVADEVAGAPVGPAVAGQFELRAALLRAIQVVGALEAACALAIEHVTTRKQFGRPLAKFQAVQHLLADLAAEATLARAAVDAAVDTAAAADSPDEFAVAVARSCAGHAASVVVRHAHQLHGAIGTAQEHFLHRLTLPVLAWRAEYGTTEQWDARVAATASAAGPDGLWGLVTGT
ncbi:acyl-CoA dehydrogenase [Amycolatopsis echigonensis]|uniref:Acyl-CoA dehydrogenase family protein n=1 Tax=Amycolatopsis echigonensis TaxID=2576905 RepID=A0A8E1VY56_9PSEU|nr:acyl-CoA dehydrogenase [Amycolatopsis echigonensis]MBB2500515.1 acyl-CoA dehydrogenase family protein [Amycolatopsis echigonensis]